MRIVKAMAIVVLGSMLGTFVGFMVGALVMPDPTFTSSGGHASPGDGLLAMGCALIGLLISFAVSVNLAVKALRKPLQP